MEVEYDQDASTGGAAAPSILEELPEEILDLIRMQNEPRFLEKLAIEALQPRLTTKLWATFESVFTDSTARWVRDETFGGQKKEIIQAFARIIHLAPHTSVFLERYIQMATKATSSEELIPHIADLAEENQSLLEFDTLQLQQLLLAVYRLLNFDHNTFAKAVSGTVIQSLWTHGDRAVRFLAIRVFCQIFRAADHKLEELVARYVGKTKAVLGDYDGTTIDYGFLSLYEERRLKDARELQSKLNGMNVLEQQTHVSHGFSSLVVQHSSTLLPRPNGVPSRSTNLVPTSTTLRNQEQFAKALISTSPVLLHGLAGSGKTALVNDFARELGHDENMVTLHLNEQTDAKMLIGMYATGSKPGSFTWRAGVLTTAIREGRWVFIEDLDRAPNEVISVILPLIERGELLIPSRGETIKAGRGFRLLASIRTTLNVSGQENPPAFHMLGSRLWRRVAVQMSTQDEFKDIISGTYPILTKFVPGIINVYDRLYTLSQKSSFATRSRTSLGRPISPRDLLKWCRRLEAVLIAAGATDGTQAISEATQYEMFLEATDCFSSSLQTEETRRVVISAIAEEMHINPQRVEHFLTAHIPRYEDSDRQITIGRVRIPKRAAGRVIKSHKKARPFANTTHAKRLLEQVGVAVKMAEPVLLVGETGIGKTTVVQQLADSLGFNLTAVNLSQQSEVGDLLGGFKPVNVRSLAIPLKDEFDELFGATGISATKNQRYLDQLGKAVAKGQWSKAAKLWREAPKMFDFILQELSRKEMPPNSTNGRTAEQPLKRRKTESRLQSLLELKPRWHRFTQRLDQFEIQLSGGSRGFAFTFVEGNIVKAARNGEWVLLDEINLASPDTLESIADLLHHGPGNTPSILLSETGEIERIKAHPNFRIFGAMNPATDVGKRDLPIGLRSRFTEIYVDSPDRDLDDLLGVIKVYLKGTSSTDEKAAHDVARLYLNTKRLADEKRLVDGANQVPHFSLRTLTRVLTYVTDISPSYGLRRSLYEGFAMGFLTLLNSESEKMLMPLINHHLLDSHSNPQALLSQTPRHPDDGREYVRFLNKNKDRQYWMLQGPEPREIQSHYIMTPFVERNMLNLVRATSTRRFPVLVQGPTSAGKTSMIEYLAKFSGNKFVRINNHEHTDLQEYLGTYVSGTDGQLKFQEGLLVQALRKGHWIVLDELNLAPTDVLEALNRLLDDNRELLIPETQEIVRPHENFMLFATQNPPGLYGGRKTLSRAFRNRFLELHFDDIPEAELDIILTNRCPKVAPSDCNRIVAVYKELSRLRQSNRAFEQKDSFATLRDLFRWALRDADTREQLASNGYMLLAERVRNPEERQAVKEVIERIMKVKIDPTSLYDSKLCQEIQAYNATSNSQGVVWTNAMRRLYVLVAHALRSNEPVLLVGETGCGKTTVCQMLGDAFNKDLHILNAHQNTETGDLIGAQRPVRNRAVVLEQLQNDLVTALEMVDQSASSAKDLDGLLGRFSSLDSQSSDKIPHELSSRIKAAQVKAKALFEWSDGPLVQAMKHGQLFLLDEISLADDSVLERLNSVLESHRSLLLAEKGAEDSYVEANDGFQFFATMNPGGDYGKRELSPALRNRFTEIWVPSLSDQEDVLEIVQSKLQPHLKQFSKIVVQFAEWFGSTYRSTSAASISVRDVLAWIKFMNGYGDTDGLIGLVHGAAMVYIDTLGANPAALLAIHADSIVQERARCIQQLSTFVEVDVSTLYARPVTFLSTTENISMGDFSLVKNTGATSDPGFAFDAPTTKQNAMRVLRALKVQKPILIEGSPGVGKTTLVAALARATNNPLTRINLSEQTDLMDLFGSDVPVEGAEAGHFAWRDAPFLQAMQRGEWVLLDEMNLASQSVLEGLNACLDHRGEVYISELDQTFKRHPNFCVFAAQNPHHQGGGRKGLPASFVNRFTVVYADAFAKQDLELIGRYNFPAMPEAVADSIITFVTQLEQDVVYKRLFGTQGGPWEFNLRDILRWFHLLNTKAPFLGAATPSDFLNLIFRQKFRSLRDRVEVDKVFAKVFGSAPSFRHMYHQLSTTNYQVGIASLPRNLLSQPTDLPTGFTTSLLPEIESIMICVQQNMPCILVGASGTGKSTLLAHVAAISGKSLITFPLNADIDTMDLVGGFEQVDPTRAASTFLHDLRSYFESTLMTRLTIKSSAQLTAIMQVLQGGTVPSPKLFDRLAALMDGLMRHDYTALADVETLASTCKKFAAMPMTLENARFEWVDGVLVKALEQGGWLVLDNANLCSSSVLDRLNSLLEPNGTISINEHCGPDGEPKVIKPHPDFRIFLTMDPRFGELSRAMRNRAIEIFLDPGHACTSPSPPSDCRLEPSTARFKNMLQVIDLNISDQEKARRLQMAALDNLSLSDLPLLSRFASAFGNALPPGMAALFQSTAKAYLELYGNDANAAYRQASTDLVVATGRSEDAQTLHPLQNSSLVPLTISVTGSDQIFWLSIIFESLVDAYHAVECYKAQEPSLELIKPSKMNRLQRSMIKDRVSSVAKDSTVNMCTFLTTTLEKVVSYLQATTGPIAPWKSEKESIAKILRFWWQTYKLGTASVFDESTFQAHLAIGTEIFDHQIRGLQTGLQSSDLLTNILEQSRDNFDSGFKLNTGLGMEKMWKHFRPLVASSTTTHDTLQQMEQLAIRFDKLRWRTSILPTELGHIMHGLVKAYRLLLTSGIDGQTLIEALSGEMTTLEASIGEEEDAIVPYLIDEFEHLRQYQDLSKTPGIRNDTTDNALVLSNFPTVSHMRQATTSTTATNLQRVDYVQGELGMVSPLTDTLSSSTLRKLRQIGNVDLKSLRMLESELQVFGHKVADSSTLILMDQLGASDGLLKDLCTSLFDIYDTTSDKVEKGSLSIDDYEPYFQPVHIDHMKPIASYLSKDKTTFADQSARLQDSALAWAHCAIALVTLYVPDRAFDPDKRQRLELEQYQDVVRALNEKLSALKQFELTFTGQDSNLRCWLLEQEIAELGPPPAVLQIIYRPANSELNQLHGEFKNLVKTVLGTTVLAILESYFQNEDEAKLQEIKLLQNNVNQIIRRLTERFHGYRDLTVPAVSMLRCLLLALSMATLSTKPVSNKARTIQSISAVTPFLGGTPAFTDDSFPESNPMEYLSLMATTSNVVNLTKFSPEQREGVLRTFHICYDQWTRRLEADRAEAESKSGLYRFRGSAEDEEEDDQEEFNELFPTFDDEVDEDAKNINGVATNSARETAVRLAEIHAEIVLGGTDSTKSLEDFIQQMSTQIGKLHDKDDSGDGETSAKVLPGVMLSLNKQILALESSQQSEYYNFYTDANLPESRKLVMLIHSVQARFRQLQAVDEIAHMQPLADVLTACRELLAFNHTEPLAKIITKVEKVHTFAHEWQFGGWTSRATSALTEYDGLTKTIVNWRRIELSTWGRLFEMETKKCEDDAKSWWFVAYQVVIAAPLQMSDSVKQLQEYAPNLVRDLESYFATAIQGQFTQRLRLLKQLQQHLALAAKDYPNLNIIYSALTNFILMFARFEKPVQEHLKRGRASLEKAMRDVLLLASWKDTNIVALRDSAKRSHHKLFKIVRKFRALLSQPMDIVIRQGIPDESGHEATESKSSSPIHFPSVDLAALTQCAQHVPTWSKKSKRFINVSKTVGVMVEATQLPSDAVDAPVYLDSFLGNIVTSAAELQKATPSILDEGTKDVVKHLKTRKRKLFADTLKELKQMGIKYNLGVNALAKQESLSLVLANTGCVERSSVSGLQYYFYKAMDLTTKARDAVKGHNEDLSGREVERSTGFLEGLLQVVITQRNDLSISMTLSRELQSKVAMATEMWNSGKSTVIGNLTSDNDFANVLGWLPNVMIVAGKLVSIHAKFGNVDLKDVEGRLAQWSLELKTLAKTIENLQVLPFQVLSIQHAGIASEVQQKIQTLSTELESLSRERPELKYIINQIVPWTVMPDKTVQRYNKTGSLAKLDQKVSKLCDSILVAVEKYKSAISKLPVATDEEDWLVSSNKAVSQSIKALHVKLISTEIDQAFGVLRTVDLSHVTTSRTAAAIFAVAQPILEQYSLIVHDAENQYALLHRATCKAHYILAKTFIQIATQGFCTPSEKADAQDGKTEKLEGGTGLGDGEGAEDISKDIQDDENLDELAQEPNSGDKNEIEDEKDAVDMADSEMEGKMGEAEEKGEDEDGSGDESEGENEMDEETGDVDDLDPTAVDEKMWDGDGEEAEKDQEGDDSKGIRKKEEQVAGQDSDKKNEMGEEGEGDEEEEDLEGAEQGEEVKQQDDVEKHDPHAEEGEALDLPDDMELDGDEDQKSVEGSDDGIDDLPDVDDAQQEEETMNDGNEEEGADNADQHEDQNPADDMDVIDLDEDQEGDGDKTEEAGEKDGQEDLEQQLHEEDHGLLRDRDDEANADHDNAVPSDVQGVGEDQNETSKDEKTDSASKTQREEGGDGGESSEQKSAAAEDGEQGRQANGAAPQDSKEDTKDTMDAQPFKKLGDTLESWHRQQTQIRDPVEQKEEDQDPDLSQDAQEFQHLQDENAEADNQAMGTATEDQARALDESMAVDSESKEMPDQFQPDEVEEETNKQDDDVMDLEESPEPAPQDTSDAYEGRAGAMIKQAEEKRDDSADQSHARRQEDVEEDVEEVDQRLDHTHLDDTTISLRSAADARQQWTHYEGITRDLSLALTEQLRLILAPTLATKMRGDFRTGKRLNIKRIIPYIASQYKRDKIWMRRSVPSKRSYQIMLAVDDSKSMGESGSGSLAFETLVMVSKSLSMLEVGEICVVGFGETVKVAHEFDQPFSSDAGPKVFQNFSFDQPRTDVTRLVRESIELFRTARAKASSTPADLWQLQLIISDGVCDSSEHEPIRRLLREALEERIMMVFVVVDDLKNKKKGESVMDLKEAKFVKNEMTGQSQVKIERYLDTFPFQYYLIVSDVRELPGVLAAVLRQWFAEVVDSGN